MWKAGRAGGPGALNPIAAEVARLRREGAGLTDLTGTNPTRHGLFAPEAAQAVARAAARCGMYEPEPRGPLAAREALASHFGGRPGDYWLTSSTSEAYSWLFALLTSPGDAVAIPAPGYPLIEPLAAFASLATRPYGWFYVHPHGWSLDTGSLERALGWAGAGGAAPVRAVIAVNPGNPTGAYLDPAARDAVVDTCDRAGAALISDEVFGPFALEHAGPAWPAASLGGEERVLTFALSGLSKLIAAPQLKCGWIRLSGPATLTAEVAPVLDRIADAYLPVSSPVALALPELLDMAPSAIGRIRERTQVNLAAAREILAAPYRVRRADGGWVALVDVPRYADDDALALHLLRSAGLAVHPGWFYDAPDAGLLALSLLPEPARFAEASTRLREAVNTLA